MICRSSISLVLKEVLSDKRTPNYKEKISWNKATKPACMDVKCGGDERKR